MHVLVINHKSSQLKVEIWAVQVGCRQHLVIAWYLYRPVLLDPNPMGPSLASRTELLFPLKWLHSVLVFGPCCRGWGEQFERWLQY